MKLAGSALALATFTLVTAGLFQSAQAGTPRHGDSVAVEAGGAEPAKGAAGPAIVNSHNDPNVDNSKAMPASDTAGTSNAAATGACCGTLADVDGLGTAVKTKPKETQPQVYKATTGKTGKTK